MRTSTKAALVVMLVALPAPSAVHAASPAKRPNILFIITDQQFAEVMSCRMGNKFLHTPAMDRLAERGVLFTRAYSSNPLCMPWRNSVFSGHYPHETGVTRNGPPADGVGPGKYPCLGTHFRNAGYDAAYSGKWHLLYNARDPSSHGFEMLSGKGKQDPDGAVADDVVKYLARPHDKPFLLVASFLNPHNICEWARRLAGRKQHLNCGEIGEPPALERLPPVPANLLPPRNEPDGMAMMRRAYEVDSGPFPVGKFTADDWRRHRWGYYRMTELVDKNIDRVLTALRQAGLEDSTLVVFTADHGECAGAHGFNQKTVFYDESARVPLILSCPGRPRVGAAQELVNTGVDLLPTMLDFAGLEIPRDLPGRSLMPLVLGKPVAGWRDHVVVENDMAQAGPIDGFTPQMEGRMVRSERYKYCLYSRGERRESLVDMQDDPGEMTDVARVPRYHEVLEQHRTLLARFGKEHHDPRVAELLADGVKPIPFAAGTPAKSSGTQ